MPTAKPAVELTPSQIQAAANLYKLASDETRLKILSFLVGGEQHVTAICEHLGQSQPAISHHLAILRVGDVIEARRDGKHNYYRLKASGRKVVMLAAGLTGEN